jgi:hypothetical protein
VSDLLERHAEVLGELATGRYAIAANSREIA